jgi:hypothetical protein
MDWNLNFISFILFVKLKCNKVHIYGLNSVLGNIINIFKIHIKHRISNFCTRGFKYALGFHAVKLVHL